MKILFPWIIFEDIVLSSASLAFYRFFKNSEFYELPEFYENSEFYELLIFCFRFSRLPHEHHTQDGMYKECPQNKNQLSVCAILYY